MSKTPTAVAAVATACALLSQAVGAQRLAWQIPPRGAAFFHRTIDATPKGMLSGGKLVVGFGFRNPAVLLQTELDHTQTHLTGDPASLWEVAMHLALDLRTAKGKGKFERTYGFMADLGAVRVSGNAGAIDGEGVQKIEAEIRTVPLPKGRYPARVHEHLVTNNSHPLRATLTIERRVDAAQNRIADFRSSLVGSVAGQKIDLQETWRFREAKPCRYPGFKTEVGEAIAAGAKFIKGQIADPDAGELGDQIDAEGRTVQSGLLALALLTLVKADVDPKDPVLTKGFASLRRRKITDTYSAAIAIMALEALYAPKSERQMLIEGRIREPLPRKPSDEDRKLIRTWADRILANVDSTIAQTAYERRFHYTAGSRFYDNSNSQYAVLGLYSAHLCGVTESATVWHSMANHWLSDQLEDGRPVGLRLVSHSEYARQRKDPKAAQRGTTAGSSRVQPAGWPYATARSGRVVHTVPLTGSMTAAGITGLTICEAVLRGHGKKLQLRDARGKKERPKTAYRRYETARQRGYAWLLDNYSVRCNKHKQSFGFHYYYLYGLERACEIGQVALIGEHDWYFEGAVMLLGMQEPRGNFHLAALYANCFAVLFLKQAAPPMPAATGSRR